MQRAISLAIVIALALVWLALSGCALAPTFGMCEREVIIKTKCEGQKNVPEWERVDKSATPPERRP